MEGYKPICRKVHSLASLRFLGCGTQSQNWCVDLVRRSSLCLSNTVEETIQEGEQLVGGRGAAVFNGGRGTTDSTILFKRKAIFKDNVGAVVSQKGGGRARF